MNYGELKAQIADYMNRKDLGDYMDGFLKSAETDIYNGFYTQRGTLALRGRANLVSAQLTPTDGVIDIPDDFLAIESVTYNGVGQDAISQQLYNNLKKYTGKAAAYTMKPLTWEQYPVPDVDTTFDIEYFSDFAGSLVDDTDTNPVLTAHSDIYLWACLAKAEIFIKNDARIALHMKNLESAIRGINTTYRRSKYSGKTLRQRTPYDARIINRVGIHNGT